MSMDTVSLVADVLGILGAAFAGFAWVQTMRTAKKMEEIEKLRKQPITLVLAGPRAEVTLPYTPRRDQLSRAELLGVLGLYGGKERFDTARLLPLIESGALDKVLNGETTTLRIPCDEKFFIAVETDLGLRNQAA